MTLPGPLLPPLQAVVLAVLSCLRLLHWSEGCPGLASVDGPGAAEREASSALVVAAVVEDAAED